MLDITIYAQTSELEKQWMNSLESALKGLIEFKINLSSAGSQPGQILFIDHKMKDLAEVLSKIDRRKRAVFLIVDEHTPMPEMMRTREVDGVLIAPFRSLEVFGKVRYFEQLKLWSEMNELNSTFSESIQKLEEDIALAERLQKAKLPKRFPNVKGFRISSRYLAGMKSGGDYFDLAESRDGSAVSLVVSDSSSYGLSGSVLSVLMRVAMKTSMDRFAQKGYSTETVGQIYDELIATLGEKDELSLFYGTLNRHEQMLRFLNLGHTRVFYAHPDDPFAEIPNQGVPVSRISGFSPQPEVELQLKIEGRLAICSQGWLEPLGGSNEILKLLNNHRESEAVTSLNEMAFRLKSKLPQSDSMPNRDCTAIILDIGSKITKLVSSD